MSLIFQDLMAKKPPEADPDIEKKGPNWDNRDRRKEYIDRISKELKVDIKIDDTPLMLTENGYEVATAEFESKNSIITGLKEIIINERNINPYISDPDDFETTLNHEIVHKFQSEAMAEYDINVYDITEYCESLLEGQASFLSNDTTFAAEKRMYQELESKLSDYNTQDLDITQDIAQSLIDTKEKYHDFVSTFSYYS